PGVSANRPNGSGGILKDTVLAGQVRDFATTWHIQTVGDTLTYPLPIARGNHASIVVRYSNDDLGVGDTIDVLVDGNAVGSFHAEDTNDWTAFTRTAAIDLGTVAPGLHQLAFRLAATDGFGIDFDNFALMQWHNTLVPCDVDGDGAVSS